MAEQAFVVEILPAARKQLERLPVRIRENIGARIDLLAQNPRPQQAKPLRGADDLWRLRVGNYRIIYQLAPEQATVLVIDIDHRKDVYRGL